MRGYRSGLLFWDFFYSEICFDTSSVPEVYHVIGGRSYLADGRAHGAIARFAGKRWICR